jgi:nitrile hydratase
MDGVHDLGGRDGFGAVARDEGPFHAAWEKRVFGMGLVAVGAAGVNTDAWRHLIERMDPTRYLTATYWERWLDAQERAFVEKGLVTRAELDARSHDPAPPPRVEAPAFADALRRVVRSGVSTLRAGAPPRFVPGDAIVVRTQHAPGHTRCPRYVRGARGVVERCHGCHVLPDAHAHGRGESPEPLYSVRFDAVDLWGEGAEGRVYVDLWESYLERGAT